MRLSFAFVIIILFFGQMLGCGGSPGERNAELIVTYENQEVYRVGSIYKTYKQLETAVADKTKKKYIIFSARWCKSCKFLNKALKQSGHWDKVILLDVDELWVSKVATSLRIKNVPTMVTVGENDNIIEYSIGPPKIIMYLVLNVE